MLAHGYLWANEGGRLVQLQAAALICQVHGWADAEGGWSLIDGIAQDTSWTQTW